MRRLRGFLPLVCLMAWAGCSSSNKPDAKVDVAPDSPGSTGGDFLAGDNGAAASNASTEQPSCLGETHQAEVIGLDIFVMVDISASMTEPLPASRTTTKWDAVKQSLETFVQAPQSADIGVGLQYFPQLKAGVPDACTASSECGNGGPCGVTATCVTSVTETDPINRRRVTYVGAANPNCKDAECVCASDADCRTAGATCRGIIGACNTPGVGVDPLNLLPICGTQNDCAGIPGTVCEGFGVCSNSTAANPVSCLPSLGCPPGGGTCIALPVRCLNQTICESSSYATPAVPISSGPTRTTDIINSLESVQPKGLTPTGAALRGALDQARTWALGHPGRQVVTVLATDGLPTECTPQDIPSIGQIASDSNAGTDPVRTFVIGVFGAADLAGPALQDLNALAQAGGTQRAFVINTGGNVGDDFLKALNQIRDTAVNCEFKLDGDAALDFDQVNLRVSDAAGKVAYLSNVGDASACGNDPGWYYTRNADGTPTQIETCPSTCAGFMTAGVSAELEVGCATRIR